MTKMYGIRELKEFNLNEYNSFIKGINTSGLICTSYYADTNAYKCIRAITANKKAKKNLSQPIQILYFQDNDLVSFQANCYAKGSLSNLNWDYDNRFQKFIPKTATNIDTFNVTLNTYATCYLPNIIAPKTKYCVVITWTLALEKISKDAIETVFTNIKKFNKNQETTIYLINNDKCFLTK